MKKRIVITGKKVADVGYRPFLFGVAESLEIMRFFADNIVIHGKNAVYALVDSTEEKVSEFLRVASSNFPENALVEKVVEEDYEGNVMKAENYYRYLSAMQLSKIATYGGRMLEKQDRTLERHDLMLTRQEEHIGLTKKMLAKQDEHIGITKEGFESVTRELKGFKELHEELRELKGEFEKLKESVAKIEKKIEA